MKYYEIAIANEYGEIVDRGGIKAARSTVYAWKRDNEQRYPFTGGAKYVVVPANDDAITLEEFYASGDDA